MLADLKKIDKAFLMEQEQSGKKGKANPSNSGKCKMVSIHDIPKKPCKDAKHCFLCKRHGGMHETHNTLDCSKYKKDGKIKKSFVKCECGSTASNKKTASAFAQLLAKIAKLENTNDKLKKSLQKHKHDYTSNSNDSDSS